MNDHELHRVVQYVTASTSYARDTVSDILHTGLGELSALAAHSTRPFEREALLEYVSQWTIKRTGQPEPLVREVLGCAGGRDGGGDARHPGAPGAERRRRGGGHAVAFPAGDRCREARGDLAGHPGQVLAPLKLRAAAVWMGIPVKFTLH